MIDSPMADHARLRLANLRGKPPETQDWCNARYHPKFLKGRGAPYWFFCRLPSGHDGEHDCKAAHEAAARR